MHASVLSASRNRAHVKSHVANTHINLPQKMKPVTTPTGFALAFCFSASLPFIFVFALLLFS